MSSTNVDLGNVEYLFLRNEECNNGEGANNSSSFSWQLPYINPREAPYIFIQVIQTYIDHGNGATPAVPSHLVFTTVNGINHYSTGGYQLATLMQRDAIAGHWINIPDSPMIQVPTNINQLNFTLLSNATVQPLTLGDIGTVDILIKIVRPQQGVITKNTMAANVKTF